MPFLKKAAFSILALAWFTLAGASIVSATSMHEACKADLEKYCSSVTPGAGRIMACLYAHEDVISGECDEFTNDMGDILDAVLGTVGDAIAICLPDIQKHCAGTKLGEGRMLSCLALEQPDLTRDCSTVVNFFAEQLIEESSQSPYATCRRSTSDT